MNQFSLSRMQALFRIFWKEQPWSAYTMAALFMLSPIGIMMSTASQAGDYSKGDTALNLIYGISLGLAGTIYAASIFKEYGQPGGTQSLLYLPATAAEKNAVKGFLMLVVFPLTVILMSFVLFFIVQQFALSLYAYRYTFHISNTFWDGVKNAYFGIFTGCAVGLRWPKRGVYILISLYAIAFGFTSVFNLAVMHSGGDFRTISLWQASIGMGINPEKLPGYASKWVAVWRGARWFIAAGFALYAWRYIQEKEI